MLNRKSALNRLTAKNLVMAAGLVMLPLQVSAATIFGLQGSVHVWQPELSGTVGQQTDGFDFSSEFDDDSGESTSLLFAIEHPIPLIPNLQLRQTPISIEASSDQASGSLGGLINFNGQIDAELDLDLLDATLYYEILDNWLTLDVGVTARSLEGFVAATEVNTGLSDQIDLNEVLPLLYGHARFDLPFSGLAVGVRGNGISFEDNTLLDVEAYLHLEVDLIPLVEVGIQGGLRRLSLDIVDLDDFNSDAALDGAYVAITGQF